MSKLLRLAATMLCAAALVSPVRAADLSSLGNAEAATGLKDALMQGAARAVQELGRENGFMGNDLVRIPLPPAVQRAEGLLRTMGLGAQADELVATMNRAAERAVPEARALLVDAARKMTVADAKGILAGPTDAATQYFRRTTEDALRGRFLPIVQKATAQVRLAESYNSLAAPAARFGLISGDEANLDRYVTQKALDGLFKMIAEQEREIRANPLAAGTNVARKVFGAILR